MKKILSLVAIFILLPPTAVNAEPFKDAAGKIHIQEIDIIPGQKVLITTDVSLTRNILFNQCGIATIPKPSSIIPMPEMLIINNNNFLLLASLPTSLMPNCAISRTTGTYALSNPVTANFKTPDGKVGLLGTPNSGAVVVYDGVFKPRSLTANKCGFVALPASIQIFRYRDSSYSKDSLPTGTPSRCIGGIKYVPVGGNNLQYLGS